MNPVVMLYARKHYGSALPEASPERIVRFTKALLIIIGADGVISELEMAAFLDHVRMMGAPEGLLGELRHFDFVKAKLEDYLDPTDQAIARRMLYDAITIAHADGYADEEHDAAVRAAELLKVDHSALTAIEALVQMEVSLQHARARLLNPK